MKKWIFCFLGVVFMGCSSNSTIPTSTSSDNTRQIVAEAGSKEQDDMLPFVDDGTSFIKTINDIQGEVSSQGVPHKCEYDSKKNPYDDTGVFYRIMNSSTTLPINYQRFVVQLPNDGDIKLETYTKVNSETGATSIEYPGIYIYGGGVGITQLGQALDVAMSYNTSLPKNVIDHYAQKLGISMKGAWVPYALLPNKLQPTYYPWEAPLTNGDAWKYIYASGQKLEVVFWTAPFNNKYVSFLAVKGKYTKWIKSAGIFKYISSGDGFSIVAMLKDVPTWNEKLVSDKFTTTNYLPVYKFTTSLAYGETTTSDKMNWMNQRADKYSGVVWLEQQLGYYTGNDTSGKMPVIGQSDLKIYPRSQWLNSAQWICATSGVVGQGQGVPQLPQTIGITMPNTPLITEKPKFDSVKIFNAGKEVSGINLIGGLNEFNTLIEFDNIRDYALYSYDQYGQKISVNWKFIINNDENPCQSTGDSKSLCKNTNTGNQIRFKPGKYSIVAYSTEKTISISVNVEMRAKKNIQIATANYSYTSDCDFGAYVRSDPSTTLIFAQPQWNELLIEKLRSFCPRPYNAPGDVAKLWWETVDTWRNQTAYSLAGEAVLRWGQDLYPTWVGLLTSPKIITIDGFYPPAYTIQVDFQGYKNF